MGEENQQKIKTGKGKLQKISLRLLRGDSEEEEEEREPEPEPALEEEQQERPRESEEEKIIVEKVTPEIKIVPSEAPSAPAPAPPSPTVVEVEDVGVSESKGVPEPEPEALIYQKLSEELSKNMLESPVSIIVKSTDLLKVDFAVLRFLMEKKRMKGVIICGDRPATAYNKLLKSRGLNPDAAYYIDVITLFTGHDPTADEKKPNVAFIHNPSDLTSLDIAITQVVERLQKDTIGDERVFLLLDCLASLQLYSTHTRLGMFVHNLTTKLKIHEVYGVIFLLEENKGSVLSSTIQTFCDRNITI